MIMNTNADPNGQFLAVKNWSLTMLPIITDLLPPKISGIINSPNVGIKTKNKPVKIPDLDNGNVTFKNVLRLDPPKSFEAKYKFLLIFSIDE